MGKYLGVDWTAKGWFGVLLRDDDTWETDLFPSIWSVWKYHSDAKRILVDVPIGLPATGPRSCDVQAKKRLRPVRNRSVFYTPVRDAVYESNLAAAKATNERAGYSIQNQVWAAVPRIREVDEFLDMYPGARDRLRETNPELCFRSFNDARPVAAARNTDEGRARRLALLEREAAVTTDIYEHAVETYTAPDYAPHVTDEADIVDALAAAVTAGLDDRDLTTLPADAPADERGLPMTITYPTDREQARLPTVGDD